MADQGPTLRANPESTALAPGAPSPLAGQRPSQPAHPASIGHYRILEHLGEGGMGIVYKAEQREPVRRIVALKVIKLGMDTKEVVARFEAERQALALMNHPNVAKVFEAGMTETGRPFFAMEHVAGVPLTDYCDSQKLSTRERLELFIPVCHAVQHAHQKGIIHRDLKPSNVLVTVVDGKPVPKVIDFGIAKATNQQLTQQTLYTQTGSLIGTPEYMSPEQAQTSGLDVDTRTDIYSLGVILYELLTGSLPFDTETLHKAGLAGMAQMIREQEPSKPSTKLVELNRSPTPGPRTNIDQVAKLRRSDYRTLQRELRGDLDWIVLRAMEKDRTRRYETATGLADDIDRYLKDEPISAGPPGTFYRVTKFVRRNRGWVTALTAIALALVMGFCVSVVLYWRADRANYDLGLANDKLRRANVEERQARDEAQRQKAEAERQRSNAQQALADGTMSQADALDLAGRWTDAGAKYAEAFSIFTSLGDSTLPAELGLWSHYRQAPPPLLEFYNNPSAAHAVAVSKDGRVAFLAGDDHAIRAFDIITGGLIRSFLGNDGPVLSISLSKDGKRLLSGSADRTVRLWDTDTGNELAKLVADDGAVSAVAISPDGLTALSGGEDHTLKLWNLATQSRIRSYMGHTQGVLAVAFSADGHRAASGGADQTIRVWDIDSGNAIGKPLTGHTSWVSSVAFTPDGATVLSASDDQTVRLWDAATGAEIRSMRGHARRVSSIAVSPDGKQLLSASDDQTLKLWDLNSGTELRTFRGQVGHILCAAFCPDGHTAISGADDKSVAVWDLGAGQELRELRGHSSWAAAVAFSADGRLALSGGYDNTARVWDVATGMELRTLGGAGGAILAVAISPDGRLAATGSADQTIQIWNLSDGAELRTLSGHTAAIQSIGFSPDGKMLVSGGADSTIRLWNVASGGEAKTLKVDSGAISSVAFSPDGRLILSAGEDKLLRLWDPIRGEVVRTLSGPTGRVLAAAFSADGRRIVSGGDDAKLRIWDVDSSAEPKVLSGSSGTVLSVAFTSDGSAVMSATEDRTIRIWDISTSLSLRTFDEQSGAVLGVAMSPLGLTGLSTSYGNEAVQLWDFDRARQYLLMLPATRKAQENLQRDPHDPQAALELGRWYAFRGRYELAIELLTSARSAGANVSSLLLGRCYWQAGRKADAVREFRIAADNAADAQEKFYLSLCISRLAQGNGEI